MSQAATKRVLMSINEPDITRIITLTLQKEFANTYDLSIAGESKTGTFYFSDSDLRARWLFSFTRTYSLCGCVSSSV
jgi:hypothetical protein